MKYLLLISHADPTGVSSAHRLAHAAKESLEGAGNIVKVLDLLKEGLTNVASPNDFNSINIDRYSYRKLQKVPNNLKKEILDQQDLIKWCDYLVIFSPMWYLHLPSIFYAWFERVFTIDFPKMNRKALFVVTLGVNIDYYTHGTNNCTSLDALLYPTTNAFNYVGFKVYETQGVYSLPDKDEAKFMADLNRMKNVILKIEKRNLLPFETGTEGHDVIETFIQLKPLSLEEAENL